MKHCGSEALADRNETLNTVGDVFVKIAYGSTNCSLLPNSLPKGEGVSPRFISVIG